MLPRAVALPQSRLTDDCGPESLCAVVNYWGRPATVEELSHLARDPQVQGIFSTDVPLLARRKGLKATVVEGTVGRLKKAIDREVPPIIAVASGTDALGRSRFHFFVVTGYSDREEVVVCEEYQDSKRLISYGGIDGIWAATRHLMVELEPPAADDFYRYAAELEAEGLWAEAAAHHRRALEADADHYEARVGLGNCLFFQGKLEEALQEYRRAYAANPADPKMLNNMAHVTLELKRDVPEALRLAERAVELCRRSFERARGEMEREPDQALRSVRRKEAVSLERDLAHALGTLGQARAADGRHELAIAAWKASHDHFALTEFSFRARRLYEIGLSYRALSMPHEARLHLERALATAQDPALRAQIEEALK